MIPLKRHLALLGTVLAQHPAQAQQWDTVITGDGTTTVSGTSSDGTPFGPTTTTWSPYATTGTYTSGSADPGGS